MITLSTLLQTSPVFATTIHAINDDVAKMNENANSAKEKVYEAQNQGEELKLK